MVLDKRDKDNKILALGGAEFLVENDDTNYKQIVTTDGEGLGILQDIIKENHYEEEVCLLLASILYE